ncbi:ADP-ribosylation/Crystallin J1 [Chthoniobacter flavus Ellin428]|uniref:ADP-ribosylation/Crystallin J1 n=1 Tax=Chthoniobacter flavus Ellin428 TaxID=497964 RepID=B4CZ90_9BACT|nr:ADP-ribosylglycohydrolase family protein [Chthoniobacter flavus]EDY20781.1 ADP-ribosylation/Crystallin J1 [Chthoniobacter flavus Ellin428]TCO89675.1 ADP-ribosylglycohydrolase [Chthoniobacter flavus]
MNAVIEEPVATLTQLSQRRRDALAGTLIGTAVGDALGLPMEGLSARRQQKLFPRPLRHRFLGRYGMVSDDTEHAFMVGQALLESSDDILVFQRGLARRLRWWLIALPAGVGYATLRAILKLWLGLSPARSGVVSAGNGPAMRSALLGVYYASDPVRRHQFVRASAEITHRDVRAEVAALAVAEVGAWMAKRAEDLDALWKSLAELSTVTIWTDMVATLRGAMTNQMSVAEFARRVGAKDGVSGYALQSVPVAIYSALSHRNDFAKAMEEAIACGGDTDTVGAITGALVGARVGPTGIPHTWRQGIAEYPCSPAMLGRVAEKLAQHAEGESASGSLRYLWPISLLRNLVFLFVVLAHALRRSLPPY